ncbi:glycosyltransferase [Kordiimonas gwangyangensis]|uniref:glycosyltransferase n=2 Tax=Kordiimonas gwangyangensis TaxID=288022 RepID=UPI00037282B2|nr:glycosyltransferase [Kordiimonas gwangyangensis]
MLKKITSWRASREAVQQARENFDPDFYAKSYPDAPKGAAAAFAHYLKKGWKLGYDPAPWFSTRAYLETYPDIRDAGLNPFVHYVSRGRAEKRPLPAPADTTADAEDSISAEMARVASSGYFDAEYYLERKPPLPAGTDPLRHFVERGWRDGRSPSYGFDIPYFDRLMGEKRQHAKNPILDFIDTGLEGQMTPNRFGLTMPPALAAPADDVWNNMTPMIVPNEAPATDIIIPVYRGMAETLTAIASVLAAENSAPANLIVIDDASPEAELSAKLKSLADKGLFTLLVNEENKGFVGTVNRGMALHGTRDVVLLNADTEVYDHWLDRLLAHAEADERIATITPLSNNATICSYPETLKNNHLACECDGAALNAAAFDANKGELIDVPTGVGFCFYIRRTALDAIGLFDEATFGRGYGEENDFCVRAAEAGWRNVIAADVYVTHRGEVSFASDAGALQAAGLKALLAKHPSYLGDVHRYIAEDPSLRARARLDAMRLKRSMGKVALFISHDWGGGIEKNIKDLKAELASEGIGVVVLRSVKHMSEYVTFDARDGFFTPNLKELHVHADHDFLSELIAILAPTLIHVHSLVAFTEAARDTVMSLVQSSGAPYYFTFHDYAPICAHGQFVTPAGNYCGEPGLEGCRTCVRRYPPVNGWVDVDAYQARYRAFIGGAKGVFAPSPDAAARANAFLGEGKCQATPHREDNVLGEAATTKSGTPGKSRNLRLAFVGAIGPHKGRRVMEACARDAWARDLKAAYRLFGYSDTGSGGIETLTIMGKYEGDKALADQLRAYKPDYLMLLSIWPETYSYALSVAFRLNIPPVVLDIGAMAERVRATGFGHVLPYEWADAPDRINDFLLSTPPKRLNTAQYKALMTEMDQQGQSDESATGKYGLAMR